MSIHIFPVLMICCIFFRFFPFFCINNGAAARAWLTAALRTWEVLFICSYNVCYFRLFLILTISRSIRMLSRIR